MAMWSHLRRLGYEFAKRPIEVRYVIVGIWNTVFGYLEWAALQILLGDHLHYVVILLLAWPVAVLVAYVSHRRLVFRSSAPAWREIPRFSLVYVVTLLGAMISVPLLLRALPLDIFLVQAGYTCAAVIIGYVLHRYFTFRAARPSVPTKEQGT